ncbi:tetratricopeptide repeat protein [Hyphomicrobium sp.]|uniref:tetratricopeptide repeat protein n=1 Tax=Hyphomicrobium sp. TaxID=82 RepID=UPI0025C07795|nr:tetratricopeptide repeat protein [Hyphomicrobium sp.]MCC7253131.1 tetratricopeptide repeat protein [Hyphomicrobium sp.]
MKRKIAAVLMADVAGARLNDSRAVVRGVLARGAGRMLPAAGEALVAEFQSAVEAVRAAVDAQATLRARNKASPPEEQIEFRLGIAIGEILDGEGELPEETHAEVARLAGLAASGGVCISRSVRDAVVSKLKLGVLDLTVEGARPEAEAAPPVRTSAKAPLGQLGKARWPWAAAAAACTVGAFALWAPGDQPQVPTDPTPVALAPTPAKPEPKPPSAGGTLEFKPAHAPDPSAVLTARRMLPKAWKECREGAPDAAVAACKLLLDSGIPKGAELADIHVANGKALRAGNDPDAALKAFSAALAIEPTAAVYSLRGNVHYDKGDWDRAIADYSEAIRRDAANGEAFNNRAWTHYRAGRPAEALHDANTAVRLLAKEAYVWDTRAHIHVTLGNREAAISDFRAALAIDPTNAASRDGLASLGVN